MPRESDPGRINRFLTAVFTDESQPSIEAFAQVHKPLADVARHLRDGTIHDKVARVVASRATPTDRHALLDAVASNWPGLATRYMHLLNRGTAFATPAAAPAKPAAHAIDPSEASEPTEWEAGMIVRGVEQVNARIKQVWKPGETVTFRIPEDWNWRITQGVKQTFLERWTVQLSQDERSLFIAAKRR